MEEGYSKISPLYMQDLKNRVEQALPEKLGKTENRQVDEYINRWHEESDNGYWENFYIYRAGNGLIDLGRTLAEMPNDILIKIAADIGVETPGLLPCIPVMKNILNQNNTNAYANFESAVKNVYDQPAQSVALAASTLEGLMKTILQNINHDAKIKNLALSELTNRTIKTLIDSCDDSAPKEIKTLATSIRGLGSAIDDLRSDKSTAHGKGSNDYIIDDALWAETVVNATTTLGLLLWRLYERAFPENAEETRKPRDSASETTLRQMSETGTFGPSLNLPRFH